MITLSNLMNILDYIKYGIGNSIAFTGAMIQTSTGDAFRTWTSWIIVSIIGVLTIAKLIKDLKK